MRINFLVNEVHGGWEPTDRRLGGTEESVVQWAEELVRRGCWVQVFRNGRGGYKNKGIEVDWLNVDGVQYEERDKWWPVRAKGTDITINVKSADKPPIGPTLYLTNETDATSKDLLAYDAVIWPSEYALENIPVNNPRKFVLPHGYDDTKINTSRTKINKQCLYASSPDRGLETLAQIWPSVVEQHPDAHLYVTYGGQIDTPETTCGEYTEEEMNNLYNTSEFWLHPASGGELYGISGIKAQAAGAIPVYFPVMALAETVQAGAKCTDARDMYNTLCELLGNQEAKQTYREELSKLELPTWKTSTDRLLEIIDEVLKS